MRVMRLGYTDGSVYFLPAGEAEGGPAVLNRPLTTGDRLWSNDHSRAELQIGGTAVRLGANTDATLLRLDDKLAQLQLSQGSLKMHVFRIGPDQNFEIDAPNLVISLSTAGDYRIDVDPNGGATEVTVREGQANLYGDRASYVVHAGQGYRFYGSDLSAYDTLLAARDDDLEHWSHERDLRTANSSSARFVSPEVVGYEDLDSNGYWRSDPQYGTVWRPHHVPAGWTPYRDGHWIWVDPWGWTWVDDAPWGYAVSHYGRWAYISGFWGWVPGPVRVRAVYAPALVVFLGGQNFQSIISIGGSDGAVGWFPLAPREIYLPGYQVSRGYFDRINRSNTVIAPTIINNVYNTHITNITHVTNLTYVNQQVSGAVVAVPKKIFIQSQPVAKMIVPVTKEVANKAEIAPIAAARPVTQRVRDDAPEAHAKPPAQERHVITRNVLPTPAAPFPVRPTSWAVRPDVTAEKQQQRPVQPHALATPSPQVNAVQAAKTPAPAAMTVHPLIPPQGRPQGEHKVEPARATVTTANTSSAPAMKSEPSHADVPKTHALPMPLPRSDTLKIDSGKADAARAHANKARVEAVKEMTAQPPHAHASQPGAGH
jgi:hypothetical protein